MMMCVMVMMNGGDELGEGEGVPWSEEERGVVTEDAR